MALPVKLLQNVQNTTVTDFQPELEEPVIRYADISSGTPLTSGTTYTADKDGWVISDNSWSSSGGVSMTLAIGGVDFGGVGSNASGRATDSAPVKKGQTYKVTFNAGSTSKFYPSLGGGSKEFLLHPLANLLQFFHTEGVYC